MRRAGILSRHKGLKRRIVAVIAVLASLSAAGSPLLAQQAVPAGTVPSGVNQGGAGQGQAGVKHVGATAASPVTKAAPAKPSAPVAEPPGPSPEHIAKARRFIIATGIWRSFEIIIPEFMDQIRSTLTQARPDLVHDMNVVLDDLKPEFEKQSDEMIDLSARIYATLLSEKDLDAILAFYESDAGKRYVAAQSAFINQLIPGSAAWQQKIAINMMTRVRQEMKKKGHDL